ncbi:MAG TPA: inositol monophosphatase family protein [Sphingobacteriaceae bacterium]
MNLNELTEHVRTAVHGVGSFIREEAQGFTPDKIEYKGLNDLVSYVDKTAEEMLVEKLSGMLPEAGFITEEATIRKTGPEFNWIIDPLDGTTNFIHGIPTFAISIALQRGEDLVSGVVYEINRDEMFYAWEGGGAYLNGKPIRVSGALDLSSTLLATGFPYYDFERQEQYLQAFSELMRSCHGLRRIGSAAVDLAYVAAGRFDGFFEYNLNAWDVAAGALIVQEAGGKVLDFNGETGFIPRRELIAGTPEIAGQLCRILNRHFSK